MHARRTRQGRAPPQASVQLAHDNIRGLLEQTQDSLRNLDAMISTALRRRGDFGALQWAATFDTVPAAPPPRARPGGLRRPKPRAARPAANAPLVVRGFALPLRGKQAERPRETPAIVGDERSGGSPASGPAGKLLAAGWPPVTLGRAVRDGRQAGSSPHREKPGGRNDSEAAGVLGPSDDRADDSSGPPNKKTDGLPKGRSREIELDGESKLDGRSYFKRPVTEVISDRDDFPARRAADAIRAEAVVGDDESTWLDDDATLDRPAATPPAVTRQKDSGEGIEPENPVGPDLHKVRRARDAANARWAGSDEDADDLDLSDGGETAVIPANDQGKFSAQRAAHAIKAAADADDDESTWLEDDDESTWLKDDAALHRFAEAPQHAGQHADSDEDSERQRSIRAELCKGKMTWDAANLKWIGNEEDVVEFNLSDDDEVSTAGRPEAARTSPGTGCPPRPLGSSESVEGASLLNLVVAGIDSGTLSRALPKDQGEAGAGMVWDAETCQWIGNEEDVTDFDLSDSEDGAGASPAPNPPGNLASPATPKKRDAGEGDVVGGREPALAKKKTRYEGSPAAVQCDDLDEMDDEEGRAGAGACSGADTRRSLKFTIGPHSASAGRAPFPRAHVTPLVVTPDDRERFVRCEQAHEQVMASWIGGGFDGIVPSFAVAECRLRSKEEIQELLAKELVPHVNIVKTT